jgi:hypothetical protein
MRCCSTNFWLIKVPPAPESMTAVVATVFALVAEKSVTGTRNSFFFPTALVTSTGIEGTDVAADPLFKNPLS